MQIPGRIAVLAVATILTYGFLFRPSENDILSRDSTTTSKNGMKTSSYVQRRILSSEDTLVNNAIYNRKKSNRVSVKLFDESLCGDCKEFVLNVLIPTYQELGPEIIDLTLVSLGNAEYMNATGSSEKKLVCQHGVAECDANSYNLCVADIYDYHIDRYLPFVACLFETLPMGYSGTVFDTEIYASCARRSAVDWDMIKNCHDDAKRVDALQKQAYAATPADHTYVPWVQINGVHWDEESGPLRDKVCETYKSKGGQNTKCNTKSVGPYIETNYSNLVLSDN
jgi:Gamma interferon inducible lysosomal thiol reductase (GILT)